MSGRPAVIELVGPAGVGKTTLSERLETGGHTARGTMWVVPTTQLIRSTVRHLPSALELFWTSGEWVWDEVKHFARLDALRTFLLESRWNGTRLVVLDEGPVYTLSWLQVIGHSHFRRVPPGDWWRRTLQRWSACLDAVVVLDAPDSVLTTRLRTREKEHIMKRRSMEEVAAFASAYRTATERVLVDLAARGGPPVLRLDMRDHVDRVDEQLRAALGQAAHAH